MAVSSSSNRRPRLARRNGYDAIRPRTIETRTSQLRGEVKQVSDVLDSDLEHVGEPCAHTLVAFEPGERQRFADQFDRLSTDGADLRGVIDG